MSIVAVGTVFPLVFAIQAAYASRNQALKCLGQMKVDFFVFVSFLEVLTDSLLDIC